MSDQVLIDSNGSEIKSGSGKKARAPYGSLTPPGYSVKQKRGLPTVGTIKSGITTFALGRWPRGCGTIKKRGDELRILLETAVYKMAGEVNEAAAKYIKTLCIHEIGVMLLQKWLRDNIDKMNFSEVAGYVDRIAHLSRSGDECLKRLGLRPMVAEQGDDWKDLWKRLKEEQGEEDADGSEEEA